MPIPAVVGAAIIGGGASLIGAATQSRAASQSAQAVQNAADSNNATQLQIYNQQRADSEPWRQFGLQALGQLSSLYNMNWTPPANMTGTGWTQTGGSTAGGTGATGAAGVGGGGVGGASYLPSTLGTTAEELSRLNQTQTQTAGFEDGIVRRIGVNAFGGAMPGAQALTSPSQTPLTQPLATGTTTPAPASTTTTAGTATATGGQPALNTAPFFASPDYQFRLNEGNRNLTNAFANTGNLDSGAAQRALLRYGQDTASGEFNSYVNRLASFSGIGQTVNQSNNALAQGYASNVQQNNNNAASARASAYQQQGQAWQQGLGGVAGAGMWALNNYPWGK